MAITSLHRRVLRLEVSQRSAERVAGVQGRSMESALLHAAFQHLSLGELRIIRDICAAMQEGSYRRDELTAEQCAALNACEAAFDEECRKAGFASPAEFYRRCKAGWRPEARLASGRGVMAHNSATSSNPTKERQ